MEWFLQHRCQLFILFMAFTSINSPMGGAVTWEGLLEMNPLSLGGMSGFEGILDSEFELLNKNFHDYKMSLSCSLKPIQKVI